MATILDDEIRGSLQSLQAGDRALCRTNPFAIEFQTERLVTADQIAVASANDYSGHFVCPKCNGRMRHYVNARGTPFFAHAAAKGVCPSGVETPSHLCIKRGMRSIGFVCEHVDAISGFKFDAYDQSTDTIAEIISSGTDRYFRKISELRSSGRRCWYIMDSGSRSLGSKDGSESICMRSYRDHGTVVISGLFKPRAANLLSSITAGHLFAFYYGLIWQSCGLDRWVLIDQDHPLSKAATADDGMKHLMVKLHTENAIVVIENKRKKIDRRTWFDRTFRYRGKFTTSWHGDRDYILDLVRQLIKDADLASAESSRRRTASTSSPSEPIHFSVDKVVERINQSHSASMEDARRLRAIAEQSQVTRQLLPREITQASAAPVVIDSTNGSIPDPGGKLANYSIHMQGRLLGQAVNNPSVHKINQLFQQCANGQPALLIPGDCADGKKHQPLVRQHGLIQWHECIKCGSRSLSRVIDRRTGRRR